MPSSMSGYSGMRGPTGMGSGNKIPKGYDMGQIQQYDPQQLQLYQSLFSQLGPESYTSRLAGGDQKLFDQMEAPAFRQFNELQGDIASRFSGIGSGSRRSSGFQNTMSGESSRFAQDLQSRRQDLQRQAIKDLMGLSGELLEKRPNEKFLVEKQRKRSWWEKLAGIGLPIAGAAGGFALGGPTGAAIGGRAGSSASQAFY